MAQEPKRAPHILPHQEERLWKWVGRYVQPRVDRRKHGRMLEQSYNPIVPTKAGNRRASARSGHGTHWREGGSKRTYLLKGDMIETQNSNRYVHRHRQNSRTRQGRSEATVLLHRSPDYSGEVVWGIPESTKGCQCWDRW